MDFGGGSDPMKASIRAEGDVTIVEMSGYLDFENAKPAADSLEGIYRMNATAKVVVDMSGLEFVGSSGISAFVKGLRCYNKLKVKPSYCGVKAEFMRLFRVFEEEEAFEISDSQQAAKDSAMMHYQQWEMRTQRSKRTH